MSKAEWKELFIKLTKSRIVLYGLIIGLFLLITVITNYLMKTPTMINMASLKPGTVPRLVPLENAEELVKAAPIALPKTNLLSPFYTDRFKIQEPQPTNAPPTPPTPPPPQFYTLNIRYMGMIENSSGFKQAFFMVNSNLVTATNSMTIITNIVVADFSPQRAVLICPNGTNTLPFNTDCQLQLPVK